MSISGIEVYNDYNSIQISSASINMVLYAKGTVTTVAPTAPYMFYDAGYTKFYAGEVCTSKASYASPADWPVGGFWAFSCTSPIGILNNITAPAVDTGSQQGFFNLACDGSVGTQVTWYYFCPCDVLTPASSGVGIQVFDEFGAMVYDSSYPIAKPWSTGVPDVGPKTINLKTYSIKLGAGRTYAYVLPTVRGWQAGTTVRYTSGIYTYYDKINRPTALAISSNTLTIKNIRGSLVEFQQSNGIAAAGEYWDKIGSGGLLLDVTGL